MKQSSKLRILALAGLACVMISAVQAEQLVLEGRGGPGKGKHIVFLVGDEEYRSEDSMPQLAKILAVHHGFKCTVLFAVNRETGEIDPKTLDNIPGLEALKTADMMVMFLRFRELPDEQMKFVIDYTNSGKPIMGLRTSTHAFNYRKNMNSPYARYSFRSKEFDGGYGRQVFGETWINHYGRHQVESTRGRVVQGMGNEVIAKGVEDIWGESDVYGLTTLPENCRPIVMGQVLVGMDPDDKPNMKKKVVPVAWTRTYTGETGKTSRVFATTMGHSFDLLSEDFRRLLVNACYWGMEMEGEIPDKSKVDFVGTYKPNKIGMGKHQTGLKPSDHRLP